MGTGSASRDLDENSFEGADAVAPRGAPITLNKIMTIIQALEITVASLQVQVVQGTPLTFAQQVGGQAHTHTPLLPSVNPRTRVMPCAKLVPPPGTTQAQPALV